MWTEINEQSCSVAWDLSLVYKHLQLRENQKNIPVHIRQRISLQMNKPMRPVDQNVPGRYARCVDCSRKRDRKTKYACTSCGKAICLEHAILSCKNCIDIDSSS